MVRVGSSRPGAGHDTLSIVGALVRLRFALAAATFASLAAACGSRTGLDEPITDAAADEGGSADSSPTTDGTVEDSPDGTVEASADARVDADDAAPDGAVEASDGGATDGPVDAPPDAPPDACASVLFVDAVHGSDSSGGSASAPFKTITRADTVAAGDPCVTMIQVRPGTYDEANGEVFPLRVPVSVALVGDEADKGDPSGQPVLVQGVGDFNGAVRATIAPSSGAVVAGLVITPAVADAGARFPVGVVLSTGTAGVTVRNDTLAGTSTSMYWGSVGVWDVDSTGTFIVGNVALGNLIGFYSEGSPTRLESNVSTQNRFGVEVDVAGVDLGGGDAGSAGHNTFACNLQNVWLAASGVFAEDNAWDHLPPSMVSDAGLYIGNSDSGHVDIFLWDAGPPTITGATLATPNCP